MVVHWFWVAVTYVSVALSHRSITLHCENMGMWLLSTHHRAMREVCCRAGEWEWVSELVGKKLTSTGTQDFGKPWTLDSVTLLELVYQKQFSTPLPTHPLLYPPFSHPFPVTCPSLSPHHLPLKVGPFNPAIFLGIQWVLCRAPASIYFGAF